MFSSANVLLLIPILVIVGYSDGIQDRYLVPLSKLATCREYYLHDHKCQHYFPIESLKNYKNDKYKLYLKLYVMTSNDANIYLTNGKSGEEMIEYAAVIGGSANTYSWLRRNGKNLGLDSHKTDILSFLWPAPIVITQTHCGEIEVSIPNVVEPLLKANGSDLDTKSICLYSWNAEGRWFYNCDEEEDEKWTPPDACGKSPEIDVRVQC